jgi:hypothetical protein
LEQISDNDIYGLDNHKHKKMKFNSYESNPPSNYDWLDD